MRRAIVDLLNKKHRWPLFGLGRRCIWVKLRGGENARNMAEFILSPTPLPILARHTSTFRDQQLFKLSIIGGTSEKRVDVPLKATI